MDTFELAGFVEQRRAEREREARLERLRRADVPDAAPQAAEPAVALRAVEPAVAAAHCTGGNPACGQPSAA